MTAIIWSTTDLVLLAVCALLGLLAGGFFIAIFVADARDAKRRAEAKKAFRRARKAFSVDRPNDRKHE
ncbi:MAG TPA: hypothetical protein VH413_00640 [Verrucomicrobiae bacterium]|jgi:hypothetical protein|nr:hypothetical protein [Verrucomicrobiae bacterium]